MPNGREFICEGCQMSVNQCMCTREKTTKISPDHWGWLVFRKGTAAHAEHATKEEAIAEAKRLCTKGGKPFMVYQPCHLVELAEQPVKETPWGA
jgi:hypothetical protein